MKLPLLNEEQRWLTTIHCSQGDLLLFYLAQKKFQRSFERIMLKSKLFQWILNQINQIFSK